MTRIRWKQTQPAWLMSDWFMCMNEFVRIELCLDTLKYYITAQSQKIIKEGQANNLVSLKKKSKLAATELGANFYSEIRNRGKTERFEI